MVDAGIEDWDMVVTTRETVDLYGRLVPVGNADCIIDAHAHADEGLFVVAGNGGASWMMLRPEQMVVEPCSISNLDGGRGRHHGRTRG